MSTESKLRSAYRTGKLHVLLSALAADQQAQWHRAVVQQALDLLEPLLAAPEEKPFVELAKRWVEAPSEEQVDHLIDYAFEAGLLSPVAATFAPMNRRQRIQMAFPQTLTAPKIQQLLLAIAVNTLNDAADTVSTIAAYAVPFNDDPAEYQAAFSALSELASRWQLDAAWAILNGQPIPPFAGFMTEGAEGDYRSGRLDALIDRMNAEQKQRFRSELMRLALRRIPPTPPLLDAAIHNDLQTCIAAAHRWLSDPTPAHSEALQRAVRLVEQAAPPKPPMGLAALRLLSDLQGFARNQSAQTAVNIAAALSQTVTADLVTAARGIVELDVTLFEEGDLDDEMFDEDAQTSDSRPDLPEVPTRRQYTAWQLEAAWAILNGQDLPALP